MSGVGEVIALLERAIEETKLAAKSKLLEERRKEETKLLEERRKEVKEYLAGRVRDGFQFQLPNCNPAQLPRAYQQLIRLTSSVIEVSMTNVD